MNIPPSTNPQNTPPRPETPLSYEVAARSPATGESSVGDGRERAVLLASASRFEPASIRAQIERTGTDSLGERLRAQIDREALAIQADLYEKIKAKLQAPADKFEYKFSSGLEFPEQGILENVNAAVAALLDASPSKRASMVEGARLDAEQAYRSHVAAKESTDLADAAARAAYAELLTPDAQHYATTVDANRLAKAHALAKDAALAHGRAEATAKNVREAYAVYATLAFGMADGSTQNRTDFLERANQALKVVREASLVEVHHRFFRPMFEEVTRAHDPCEPLVAKDFFQPSQKLDKLVQAATSPMTYPVGGYQSTTIRSITGVVLVNSLTRHLENLTLMWNGTGHYLNTVTIPMYRKVLEKTDFEPVLSKAAKEQVNTVNGLSDNEIEQQLRDLDAALKALRRDLDAALKADVRRDLDGIISVMGDTNERKAYVAAKAYAGSLEAHVFASLFTSANVIDLPEPHRTVTKEIKTKILDCTDEAFAIVRRMGETLQVLQPSSTFRFSDPGNAA